MRFLLAILFSAHCATGATLYLREGAAGAATGANWTDAFTTWAAAESAVARGDTIYVATGNYTSGTFNVGHSGATLITVKKATVADHGTSTGWLDSYATGKPVFTGLMYFQNGFITFNGQTNYGIKFTNAPGNEAIWIPGGTSPHNVTFEHVEITMGTNQGPPYSTGLYAPSFSSNLTVRWCWIHDVPGDMFQLRGITNFTLEYSLLQTNWSDATRHGDFIENDSGGVNYVVRYNTIEGMCGTYIFGHHNTGDLQGYDIYGNIIKWPLSWTNKLGNGLFSSLSGGTGRILGGKFYQNTILWPPTNGGNNSVNPYVGGSTITASNNLWIHQTNDASAYGYGTNTAFGKDWLVNKTNTAGGNINTVGFPVVSYDDPSLLTNSLPGAAMPSPYDVDRFARAYAQTIGAMAFLPGVTLPPTWFGAQGRFRP